MSMNGLRRIAVAGLSGAVCIAGVVGMTLPAHAQDSRVTVRSVPIGNLQILDPIWTSAYITRNHGYMIWDTLFATDANGEIQPQMVDEWSSSEDGLDWTFTLREGLLWHDGEPVTAADCVASLKRWAARDAMGRNLMGFVSDLSVVDDKTFSMTLSEPIGFVLDALGKIDSNVPFMMPARVAETDPSEQIQEMIGSGPFRFVAEEWVPGSMVVYEKFEEYVPRDEPSSLAAGGKVVHIDRVESVYMPDAGVAAAAVSAGEIDLIESPPPNLLELFRDDEDVVAAPNDPLGFHLFMAINHLHPPFNDKQARQAALWGFKQADFLATAIGDPERYQECAAFYGCGTLSDSDAGSEAILGHDLERAKELLAASSYDGEPVVLLDPADHATMHPAILVAAQSLRDIGFNVQVDAMDWSTLVQRRASQEPPTAGGWSGFITAVTVTGVSNPLVNPYSQQCENASSGWPCDPEIVELTAQWTRTTDAEKRLELVNQMQALHAENVTYIPLGQYRPAVVYRKDIRDMIQSPVIFYWNLKK